MERKQPSAQQTQAMEVQYSECVDPHKRVRSPMVETCPTGGFYGITQYLNPGVSTPRKDVAEFPARDLPNLKKKKTIPIDDYVHKKLKDQTTGIKVEPTLKPLVKKKAIGRAHSIQKGFNKEQEQKEEYLFSAPEDFV
ncbi:hypothetical protein BB561_006098 [Smittium simulii]|uniref:Uncharacterized protein n=1 Tax=Smittium simulii TaxID=133385 RepID=A0A2T9Y6H5_9FUNG|nr:hypothetical protein BB561_006098 [Smittium simulii]